MASDMLAVLRMKRVEELRKDIDALNCAKTANTYAKFLLAVQDCRKKYKYTLARFFGMTPNSAYHTDMLEIHERFHMQMVEDYGTF